MKALQRICAIPFDTRRVLVTRKDVCLKMGKLALPFRTAQDLQCCRWVHKKLLSEGDVRQRPQLAAQLLHGQREVNGGSHHYRDLHQTDEYTDLTKGYR